MTGFIEAHGGYRKLISYRKAQMIFDGTVMFCERFLSRRDRTRDQMIQAARSGKQNIAEGSIVSGTSKELEIKLTNVARASLEELLVDYEDFLRVSGYPIWSKESSEALWIRKTAQLPNTTFETYRRLFETRSPGVLANIMICLVHQANYLLDRQIKQLERQFLSKGGIRERMTRARLASRKVRHGDRRRQRESWDPGDS